MVFLRLSGTIPVRFSYINCCFSPDGFGMVPLQVPIFRGDAKCCMRGAEII